MLQSIRNRLTGWVAIGFIILIGVPLALTFGTGDLTTGGSNYAARVNGEEIPRIQFDRVYQNQIADQPPELRRALTPELEVELKRAVLDSFVATRALGQHVEEAGYRVSDAAVADHIRALPAFQVGGQFSKPAYDAALITQGVAPTTFEDEQRVLLSVRQLQEGLDTSAFYTPTEFRRLIELETQRRDLGYVLFDVAKLASGVEVTDADVQEFYSGNEAQFQAPESADLEYIELRLADLGGDYEPDEETLREAYEADPLRFRSAEERRASHILVAVDEETDEAAAKAEIEALAKRLEAGEDFAELAAEHSDDPGSASRGGDLGWSGTGAFVPAFEEAVFSLEPGGTSGPVRTEFGYHLIRLQDVRPGEERPFDEVRDELAAELRERRAQDEYYGLAERLDDLALENPGDLETAARETGLELRTLSGFTRSGGGPLGDDPRLVDAVFSIAVLEGEENTPLVELEDGRAVVARVVRHQPRQTRPLAEVRDEIVARLKNLRASTEAAARGEALLAAAREGEGLAEAAADAGVPLVEPGLVNRQTASLPPGLLQAVFQAPRPAEDRPTVQGAPLDDGSYAVFQVSRVVDGSPEAVAREQRDRRKQTLARQTAAIEAAALVEHVKSEAKVVVAEDLLEPPAEF